MSGSDLINATQAREIACRYLARREYSEKELLARLEQKGVPGDIALQLVDSLADENLVSDERFAEAFCRQRVARRYGPLKIRAELRSRGVADELVAATLEAYADDWHGNALDWVRRRATGPMDRKQKARLYRSGQNRGFSHDQIMRAIDKAQKND